MNALEVRDLNVRFPTKGGEVIAVNRVNLNLPKGKTLGLVGESGSGKSTIARAVMRLIPASTGSLVLDGKELGTDSASTSALRRAAQMVFQDPNSSLNPRLTVSAMLVEASGRLELSQRQTASELLDLVSLPKGLLDRFPHQLSGGQKQRVALARALAVRPSILIADEITSALDVSVQASVLNLLSDLQETLGLTYLFISHNLAVVRHLSDEIAVMYLGRIVEHGPADRVFSAPEHPYTRALLDSVPGVSRESGVFAVEGEVPDPRFPPSGCAFHTRCPAGPLHQGGREGCHLDVPQIHVTEPGHSVACHHPNSVLATLHEGIK